ncbi:MAG: sulfotransferase domain-containing protein [Candidatus Thermoplasmatota archaeon]
MEKKCNVFLHIGMQRTGSTFMQDEVFSKVSRENEEYNYIGREEKVVSVLRNLEDLNPEKIEDQVLSELEDEKINIISGENIYCHMWEKEDERYDKLEKIYHLFPDGKIIFGVREKEDLLVSWYKKYVVNGGTLKIEDFLEEIVNTDKLEYKPYLEELQCYFGKENVFVYRLRELKKDPEALVEKVCSFIGSKPVSFKNVKHNVGYSLWQLKVSRVLNNLFKSSKNPDGLIPLHHRLHIHRMIFQNIPLPKPFRGKEVTLKDLKS